ncbi:Ribonuclease H-like domain [Cinara cedri]|uniref:Ribonuclease H-like domain n=1 Tax=Cinara cedri TaxID=506608 RepID=A0A5E4MFN3_9HEMI|nr:Ribonuclease H-like domain [Cinara cedri]
MAFVKFTSCISEIRYMERDNVRKKFLGCNRTFPENISLKSFCLTVTELKEWHTGQYISEQLENILSDWEINQEKIVSVVTDNGANVVSAVNKTFGKH